jgi:type I restriction enzyme, S subunit
MGKLPKNWVETDLGKLLKLKNGFAFKSKDYIEEGIPIIRMSDIVEGNISLSKAARVRERDEYERYVIEKGDILIGMSGSIGKYGVFDLDEKVYLNQRVGNLKLYSKKHVNKNLINYIVGNVQREIVGKAYGGAVPNISGKDIESTLIGLPPLPEQQRIVAKLDDLFGHLEQVKTRLALIPDLLKNFRQAILTQAVTGQLTEEWREGKELGEWRDVVLKDVSERITVGYVGKMSDQYKEEGIPFLRSQNVRAFRYSDNNLLYVSKEFHNSISKSSLKAGDVAIVRSGYPGTACVIPNDLGEANCSDILILTPKKSELNGHFVTVFMNSDAGKRMVFQNRVGNAQQHFNTKTLQNTVLSLAPIEEQTEIVKRVESLFAKADAIEAKYNTLKAQIDSLPQAILAKAFKGELVEQLPTDGNAADLLKEIQKLKAETQAKGKKKKKKL